MYYYDYFNCTISQSTEPAVSFPEIPWRTDILLSTPILTAPRNNTTVCLNSAPGAGTGIVLQWKAVAGATHYIVQWGKNAQMSLPHLREAVVLAPTTEYELINQDDIRLGETVYWRVLAVNKVGGGASPKSEIRTVTFNCGNQSDNTGLDRCTDYDVQLQINGTEYASCCDENTFWLELTYKAKDQFERELITIADIAWDVDTDSSSGGTASIKRSLLGGKKVTIETCGENSQVFKITATVTFNDNVIGDTFECSATKYVFMDCDTPFHERPWFPGHNGNCDAVCLHPDYTDDYPWGLMYNPDCPPGGFLDASDCGGCLTVFEVNPQDDEASEVLLQATIVNDGACPGETLEIELIAVNVGPLPSEPIEFDVIIDGCGFFLEHTIDFSFFTNQTQSAFGFPALGENECPCSITITSTLGHSISFSFIADGVDGEYTEPEECRLNSYENIVVATGPVFRVPAACQGVETECCECTPESIGFYMDSLAGAGYGVLQFDRDSNAWGFDGKIPAFDVSDFFGPVDMYCGTDGSWIFRTYMNSNADCVPIAGCNCIPRDFTATLEWELPDTSTGSRQITLRWDGASSWIADLQVFKPDCDDPLILSDFEIDFALAEVFIGQDGAWTPTLGLWVVDCDPLGGFAEIEYNHPTCDTPVLITITWSVTECGACLPNGWIMQGFDACDPFSYAFNMSHEDFPNDVYVHIGTAVPDCYCGSADSSTKYLLEARVNIPLSCHFKVVNGQLALNLTNLLGPGLYIGVNPETGCEYVGSYGGYGGDPVIYTYTLIYCCYSVYDYMASSESLSAFDVFFFEIDDPELPEWTAGVAISPITLTANNGLEPYTFGISEGSLPSGVDLVDGVISGTPTVDGTGPIRFYAVDGNGMVADSSVLTWSAVIIGP